MTATPARLLDQLKLPDDLRTLDADKLRIVAEEVRQEIIGTISENGGHLGASLGVVELTIALHAELQTPRDAIVWDVGHQSYAHKLLTGRLDHPHVRGPVRVPLPQRERVRRLRDGAQQQFGERRCGDGGRRAPRPGGGGHRGWRPHRRHRV